MVIKLFLILKKDIKYKRKRYTSFYYIHLTNFRIYLLKYKCINNIYFKKHIYIYINYSYFNTAILEMKIIKKLRKSEIYGI